ncbi:gp439 [Bacillus phage G]|uniref:Gp439 n=1 Tax=Bacillus phage G TaxID=2884420 RepID=G3MAI0_9CAUD|nr:gp439 [Bacillus phage G]AEO93697.1 gp439 [Bacillus phage G]
MDSTIRIKFSLNFDIEPNLDLWDFFLIDNEVFIRRKYKYLENQIDYLPTYYPFYEYFYKRKFANPKAFTGKEKITILPKNLELFMNYIQSNTNERKV